MNDFRESLGRFRKAMHQEGAQTEIPGLQEILLRERLPGMLRPHWAMLAWAAATAVALTLAAIPAYQNAQRQREADEEKADAVLLQQVNTGLSRSVPRAMMALMNGTPGN